MATRAETERRRRKVLLLYAQGRDVGEISELTGLAPRSVRNHIQNAPRPVTDKEIEIQLISVSERLWAIYQAASKKNRPRVAMHALRELGKIWGVQSYAVAKGLNIQTTADEGRELTRKILGI